MDKQYFNISCQYQPISDAHIIHIDGHDIGIKILCYYDDNDNQVLDIYENIPGHDPVLLSTMEYGKETKIFKLDRTGVQL